MIIDTAQRISTVEEYYFSKKLKELRELNAQGKNIVNLGIGSPDLPPHPEVIEALSSNASLPDAHGYQSYQGIPELRTAFADWANRKFQIQLNANEVLPLMGSKEGIMHLSMTFLEKGDQVLVPNPGYPTYTSATQLTGAEIVYYNLKPENQYWPDFEELEKLDTSKIKLMWINYPHMPTGANGSKPLFEKLVKFALRHRILLCHDNPYAFILNDHATSILEIDGANKCAVELHSLSKAYNMAGWRVGALFGNEDILKEVIKFKSNMDSGMFKPLQIAAIKALSLGEDWHNRLNAVYSRRRAIVFELFDYLDCSFDRNQSGLFVWAKIPTQFEDGIAFSDEYLYHSNVFITPGNIFGSQGNSFVRISLCSDEKQLEEAFNRIRAHVEKNLTV